MSRKAFKRHGHGDLEWNDAVAGARYRLVQASEILRSVKIVYLDGDERKSTRAYQHVRIVEADGERRSVYMPAQIVWNTEDLANQVRDQALSDLRAYANRYREYTELSGIVERIDQLLLEVE